MGSLRLFMSRGGCTRWKRWVLFSLFVNRVHRWLFSFRAQYRYMNTRTQHIYNVIIITRRVEHVLFFFFLAKMELLRCSTWWRDEQEKKINIYTRYGESAISLKLCNKALADLLHCDRIYLHFVENLYFFFVLIWRANICHSMSRAKTSRAEHIGRDEERRACGACDPSLWGI